MLRATDIRIDRQPPAGYRIVKWLHCCIVTSNLTIDQFSNFFSGPLLRSKIWVGKKIPRAVQEGIRHIRLSFGPSPAPGALGVEPGFRRPLKRRSSVPNRLVV